jgi:hypothetical protein
MCQNRDIIAAVDSQHYPLQVLLRRQNWKMAPALKLCQTGSIFLQVSADA